MVQKKEKYSRNQRREIDRLSEVLTSLIEKYLQHRALYGGDCEELLASLNKKWRDTCSKHNSIRKHQIRADDRSFMRQIESKDDLELKAYQVMLTLYRKEQFKKWSKKVEMMYPGMYKVWKLIDRFSKNDYIQSRYEKFEGESPRGSWF